MGNATFYELRESGLIVVEGEDAVAFLHAQLTSDVAGLGTSKTQYSGYCSPKGRLLATFLVWRLQNRVFLQLPLALSEVIRARLAKYVLRTKVRLAEGRPQWKLFAVSGPDAAGVLASVVSVSSIERHEVAATDDVAATKLAAARYLILAPASDAPAVRATLEAGAHEEPETAWAKLDIEAGVPWIVPATQDEYIPQMVNLDLIGGVSYSKGCYPGQEIVARTHHLGRVKQRMHHIRMPDEGAPDPGDPLYSALFGSEQASGTLVNAAPHAQRGHVALAVIHTAALSAGGLRWKSFDGPAVELLALPYSVPS